VNKENIILGEIDITSLLKAFDAFTSGLSSVKTELERDGVIKRFEFTYELVWKTLKRVLKHKGLDIANPRDVFRAAAKEGFVSNVEVWFEFLKNRNLTVHTYNSDCAEEIFDSFPAFKNEIEFIIDNLKKL
jgi:nucleotidyltransferase substrate binding protein (TIGR01987 family)